MIELDKMKSEENLLASQDNFWIILNAKTMKQVYHIYPKHIT